MQHSIVFSLTVAFTVLIIVLVLPTTPYAIAGTDIVRIFPNGDFVAAGWSDSGCQTDTSRWDELDESPPDGVTTCRSDSASNALQVELQDPNPPAGTITNIAVQLFATIRVVSGSPLFDVDLISAGCETLNAIVDNQPGSVFVTVSATANDTRCGLEWTQNDLNALRISPFCQDIGQCSITNTYVDITYESESPPPPGTGGDPPAGPPPIVPPAFQKALELCNLWIVVFLLLVLLTTIGIRRAKVRGPAVRP